MIRRLARQVFGLRQDRALSRYRRAADEIVALSLETESLSSEALRERIRGLRRMAAAGSSLDTLAVPTFALVREAARRELGERPVPAQLICGFILQANGIAEMKTGEGKTLAATLVCALNALTGHGVHVATPNDYLAERDAAWMRPVYEALGFSVGVITQHMDDDARRAAYACDVTYGIASEFGFDYLRDNMKFSSFETVQRGHTFALVDEADGILIDEAGMPLSLFGPLGDQSDLYILLDSIVAELQPGHYEIDDRRRAALTDAGYDEVQHRLRAASLIAGPDTLHDTKSITMLHHVMQALRARTILLRDRDYIVSDGEIVIVDRFSGRLMHGRRYDDGLHQALEAKEGCRIGDETRTLASITFQCYFRKYKKLAGMTGTAVGDREEYRDVYGMDVISVAPHRPLARRDDTVLHETHDAKLAAILRQIEEAHLRQQPVLVGVPSVPHSDRIVAMLEANGWTQTANAGTKSFSVLNAKRHMDEARIIAQAGKPGAVTVATAMAGRGTDIRLGGADHDVASRNHVIAAGGLLVIGTEHHDYRRLDDQLRGRAGRQGDPGRSTFHACFEDHLLTHFDDMSETGTPAVDLDALTGLIASAQKRKENHSLDNRLGLMAFDNVIEKQREIIYEQRRAIRDDSDPLNMIDELRYQTIDDLLETFAPPSGLWDMAGLDASIRSILTLAVPLPEDSQGHRRDCASLRRQIAETAQCWMLGKVASIGCEPLRDIMRKLMMALLDQLWTEQTERLEHLKRAIGDRRLPRHKAHIEFQSEAFLMFSTLMKDFRHEVTAHAMRIGVRCSAQ